LEFLPLLFAPFVAIALDLLTALRADEGLTVLILVGMVGGWCGLPE
jgi:hypothetical protein